MTRAPVAVAFAGARRRPLLMIVLAVVGVQLVYLLFMAENSDSHCQSSACQPSAATGGRTDDANTIITTGAASFVAKADAKDQQALRRTPGQNLAATWALLAPFEGCPAEQLNNGFIHYYSGLPIQTPKWGSVDLRREWAYSYGDVPVWEKEMAVYVGSQCNVSNLFTHRLDACHESSCMLEEPPPEWDLFAPSRAAPPRCEQRKFSWLQDDTLHMCCPPGYTAQWLVPSTPLSREWAPSWWWSPAMLANSRAYELHWVDYTAPVSDLRARMTGGGSSSIVVRCGSSINVHFLPPPIPQAQQRARRVLHSAAAEKDDWQPLEELSASRLTGFHRSPALQAQGNAMNVVVLMIDSVSRVALARYAPRTTAWLQSQYTNDDSAVDVTGFTRLLVMGGNSPPNQVPLYGGHPCRQPRPFVDLKLAPICDNDDWLWLFNRPLGYVSMVAHELCKTFVSAAHGVREDRAADSVPAMSGCNHNQHPAYVSPRLGLRTCNYQEPLMGHLLRVVERFLDEQRAAGLPAFVSATTASFHFDHWPAIQNLDDILPEFLHAITHRGDTAVLLMGDHGNNHAPLAATAIGMSERFFPSLHMLTPKGALTAEQLHTLRRNSLRLTSPYDLYRTMKQLMVQHTGRTLEDGHAREPKPGVRAYNLLSELVPRDRKCNQMTAEPVWACPCDTILRFPADSPVVKQILERVVLPHLNGHHDKLQPPTPCHRFTLRRTISATFNAYSSETTYYFETTAATSPVSKQEFEAVVYGLQPTLEDSGTDINPDSFSVRFLKQMSRWGHFQDCRDVRVETQFCACTLKEPPPLR